MQVKPPSSPETKSPSSRVLLADDEPEILAGFARYLRASGYVVDTAAHGQAAVQALSEQHYNAVISDISMPGMGGLDLLRAVRRYDQDVPVILMTGGPAVETAMTALEHGALRYLIKPVDPEELKRLLAHAILLHAMAKAKREALNLVGDPSLAIGDRASANERFDSALQSLWMAFQPIVSWHNRHVFGYEALVRTGETSFPHPGALFDAAERLNRLEELSRKIRATVAQTMPQVPSNISVFVNLHTRDLLDPELYSKDGVLTPFAKQIVYEITERVALDEVSDARARIATLRDLGFRIAIDDLGAGYAGLTTFAHIEPEVVKLDMSLIRDVHTTPTKQKLITTMVQLCQELNISVVAEGIENNLERDMLGMIGIDLMQGYFFGRPDKGLQRVAPSVLSTVTIT